LDIVLHPADAVRSIQETIPIAQRGFFILVDREHDRLHMMGVPMCRTSASARIQGGLNTISAEQVLKRR
jgi:hypothetical protein